MRFRLSVPVWALIACALFSLMTMIMLTFMLVGIDSLDVDYSIWEILRDVGYIVPYLLPQALHVLMLYMFLNTWELSAMRIILSLIALSPYVHIIFVAYCVLVYGYGLGILAVQYLVCFIMAEGFPTYYVVRYLSNALKAQRHRIINGLEADG